MSYVECYDIVNIKLKIKHIKKILLEDNQMENKRNDLVLIVDDNPNNIQVLATIMAECGYELGIAQNAYEVYQFLE